MTVPVRAERGVWCVHTRGFYGSIGSGSGYPGSGGGGRKAGELRVSGEAESLKEYTTALGDGSGLRGPYVEGWQRGGSVVVGGRGGGAGGGDDPVQGLIELFLVFLHQSAMSHHSGILGHNGAARVAPALPPGPAGSYKEKKGQGSPCEPKHRIGSDP